jgi:hypothetical protein
MRCLGGVGGPMVKTMLFLGAASPKALVSEEAFTRFVETEGPAFHPGKVWTPSDSSQPSRR